jgi:hypothetical protein
VPVRDGAAVQAAEGRLIVKTPEPRTWRTRYPSARVPGVVEIDSSAARRTVELPDDITLHAADTLARAAGLALVIDWADGKAKLVPQVLPGMQVIHQDGESDLRALRRKDAA